MSDIYLPLNPRPHEDPAAAGVVQSNLEYVMTLFEKGVEDGDTLVWDVLTGRYQAKAAGGVTVSTGLPVGGVKPGQECIVVDNLVSPTFHWHLRYNQDSLSPYKWECIGATPAYKFTTGDVSASNTPYADTPGGPSFTLPAGIGGDFMIAITGCIVVHAAGGDVDRALMSYRVGATPASDTWAIRVEMGLTDTEGGVTGYQQYRHTNVAAGAAIICQNRQEGGAGHRVLGARTLSVTPIRVGA